LVPSLLRYIKSTNDEEILSDQLVVENFITEGLDIGRRNKNNCEAENFHTMFSCLPNHKDSTSSGNKVRKTYY